MSQTCQHAIMASVGFVHRKLTVCGRRAAFRLIDGRGNPVEVRLYDQDVRAVCGVHARTISLRITGDIALQRIAR